MSKQPSARRLFCEQVLVFPFAVTLLSAVALLCGGSIAYWQWWVVLAAVLAMPFVRGGHWKKAAAASGGFLALVFGVWLYTGMTITESGYDQLAYHFPAIRLLMLGWNPIWQPTAEEIYQFGALEPESLRIWHLISMPRPVWYFSACAAFFSQNQFNLYYPILLFMLVGTSIAVCRCLREVNVILRIVAVLALVWMINEHFQATDAVAALAFAGLVASQFAALRDKEDVNPLSLIVFSFWLCSAKQLGVVFCAVAWGVFIVAGLIRWRKDWKLVRLIRLGAIAAALVLVANVSPYITNTIAYSHPFYPNWTFDEEKHPVKTITKDFLDSRNEDAEAMEGRLPMYLNAFVCPSLVHKYYARKLNKPDFNPRCTPWSHSGYPGGYYSPLNASYRFWFLIPVLVLLVFGKTPERFAAIVMLLCTFLVPAEMIGYERYVRFIHVAYVFTFPMLCHFCAKIPYASIVLMVLAVVQSLDLIAKVASVELNSIDRRLAIHDEFKHGLPDLIYYNRLRKRHFSGASLELMRRFVPYLATITAENVPDDAFERKAWPDGKIWPEFPDRSFRTPHWFNSINFIPSLKIREEVGRSKPDGALAGALYEFEMFWRCLVREFPRAMWLRLSGDMAASLRADPTRPVCSDVGSSVAASERFLSRWQLEVTYDTRAPAGASIEGCDKCLNWKYPKWLAKDNHQGCYLQGTGSSVKAVVKCSHDGKVTVRLRTPKVSVGERLIETWCDYGWFHVNGQSKLAKTTATSFKQYHDIPVDVKAGQTLSLVFEIKPHRYKREELRQLLLDMAERTHATESNIEEVLSRAPMKPFMR